MSALGNQLGSFVQQVGFDRVEKSVVWWSQYSVKLEVTTRNVVFLWWEVLYILSLFVLPLFCFLCLCESLSSISSSASASWSSFCNFFLQNENQESQTSVVCNRNTDGKRWFINPYINRDSGNQMVSHSLPFKLAFLLRSWFRFRFFLIVRIFHTLNKDAERLIN